MDVLDARADGFTPCGVCKPDQALAQTQLLTEPPAVAAATAAPTTPPTPALTTAPTTAPAADVTQLPGPAPVPRTERVVPAEAHVSLIQPIPAAPVGLPTGAGEPPESALAVGLDLVVAVPARGRFHTPSCRYVHDAGRAQQLTRAAAVAEGYQACGICKP